MLCYDDGCQRWSSSLSIVRLQSHPAVVSVLGLYVARVERPLVFWITSPLVLIEADCATAPFVVSQDQLCLSARSATAPNAVLRDFGGLVDISRHN